MGAILGGWSTYHYLLRLAFTEGQEDVKKVLGVFYGLNIGDEIKVENGEIVFYIGRPHLDKVEAITTNGQRLWYDPDGTCVGGPCSSLGKFDYRPNK